MHIIPSKVSLKERLKDTRAWLKAMEPLAQAVAILIEELRDESYRLRKKYRHVTSFSNGALNVLSV